MENKMVERKSGSKFGTWKVRSLFGTGVLRTLILAVRETKLLGCELLVSGMYIEKGAHISYEQNFD